MRVAAVMLCVAALSATMPARAQIELARQRVCLGCHDVEARRVGPPLRAIAARYAGQPDAVARLSRAMIAGSVDVWGPIPMPPNPKLSSDEARRLATWILSLK